MQESYWSTEHLQYIFNWHSVINEPSKRPNNNYLPQLKMVNKINYGDNY